MDSITFFYAVFTLTALLLVASIVSGKTGRRRAHLPLVIATTIALLYTIWEALQLAKVFDFPEDRYRVHMPIARVAFVSLLGPWITGPLYWKGKVGRKAHLIGVSIFLACAAGAIVTGGWMLAGRIPK